MFASSYPDTGQQRVAVVLVDDAYVMRNGTSWPMPYGEQSKLFKRLLAYKPKAVFVDLLYSHDHSLGDPERGSQLLANVFERYQRQGIPLLLANTGVIEATVRAFEDAPGHLADRPRAALQAIASASGHGSAPRRRTRLRSVSPWTYSITR